MNGHIKQLHKVELSVIYGFVCANLWRRRRYDKKTCNGVCIYRTLPFLQSIMSKKER